MKYVIINTGFSRKVIVQWFRTKKLKLKKEVTTPLEIHILLNNKQWTQKSKKNRVETYFKNKLYKNNRESPISKKNWNKLEKGNIKLGLHTI